MHQFLDDMYFQYWGWALTTILSISTLLKNTLSKVSFSNLLTNDFLDHPRSSEGFFIFTLSRTTLLNVEVYFRKIISDLQDKDT